MIKRLLLSARPRLACGIVALGVLGTSALAVWRPAAAGAASPSMAPSTVELAFEWSIEVERVSNGLPPLAVDPMVSAEARQWSGGMALFDTLAHSASVGAQIAAVDPQWQALGENVGEGTSPQSIAAAFMASPHHRANILGAYSHMGVGVFVDGLGRIWVTERFYR